MCPSKKIIFIISLLFLSWTKNYASAFLRETRLLSSSTTINKKHKAIIQSGPTKIALYSRNESNNREPIDSNFGRQEYWNKVYETESEFSWYAGWEELQPFCDDFFEKTYRVLIPGVGNDAAVVGMFDDGYKYLTAMDYAPEGIERCKEMLGEDRIQTTKGGPGVDLLVADARDLVGDEFKTGSFDAVLEKGTLDAIFLSGGKDKKRAIENLKMSISELGRCVRPGGIFMSITAVVDDQIQASFDERQDEWECLIDKETLYTTEDGYTSNNIDGNLLVWRKKS